MTDYDATVHSAERHRLTSDADVGQSARRVHLDDQCDRLADSWQSARLQLRLRLRSVRGGWRTGLTGSVVAVAGTGAVGFILNCVLGMGAGDLSTLPGLSGLSAAQIIYQNVGFTGFSEQMPT